VKATSQISELIDETEFSVRNELYKTQAKSYSQGLSIMFGVMLTVENYFFSNGINYANYNKGTQGFYDVGSTLFSGHSDGLGLIVGVDGPEIVEGCATPEDLDAVLGNWEKLFNA